MYRLASESIEEPADEPSDEIEVSQWQAPELTAESAGDSDAEESEEGTPLVAVEDPGTDEVEAAPETVVADEPTVSLELHASGDPRTADADDTTSTVAEEAVTPAEQETLFSFGPVALAAEPAETSGAVESTDDGTAEAESADGDTAQQDATTVEVHASAEQQPDDDPSQVEVAGEQETVEPASAAPARSRAVVRLHEEWGAFEKKSRVRAPSNEKGRMDVLEWAIEQCAMELPRDLTISVERDESELLVTIERGGDAEQVLVPLCDESLKNGVLLRRIKRVRQFEDGRIVMLRSEPFPEGQNRTTATLEEVEAEGWGMFELDASIYRHLKVVRSFVTTNERKPSLPRWMAAERPLLGVEFLADIFQNAEVIDAGASGDEDEELGQETAATEATG